MQAHKLRKGVLFVTCGYAKGSRGMPILVYSDASYETGLARPKLGYVVMVPGDSPKGGAGETNDAAVKCLCRTDSKSSLQNCLPFASSRNLKKNAILFSETEALMYCPTNF